MLTIKFILHLFFSFSHLSDISGKHLSASYVFVFFSFSLSYEFHYLLSFVSTLLFFSFFFLLFLASNHLRLILRNLKPSSRIQDLTNIPSNARECSRTYERPIETDRTGSRSPPILERSIKSFILLFFVFLFSFFLFICILFLYVYILIFPFLSFFPSFTLSFLFSILPFTEFGRSRAQTACSTTNESTSIPTNDCWTRQIRT